MLSMRSSRIVALLSALALSLPVALLSAGPAHAGPLTQISLTQNSPLGVYADGVGPGGVLDHITLTALLSDDLGAPLAGKPVALERRRLPSTEWRQIDTTTTNGDGVASFTTPVKGNARYRVTFAGEAPTYDSTVSNVTKLAAMRDFNARLVKKDGKVFLKGNINPGWGGKKVAWQHKKCARCDWKTIATKRAGAKGAWMFRGAYPARIGPVWFFRARLAGTKAFIASVSAELQTERT